MKKRFEIILLFTILLCYISFLLKITHITILKKLLTSFCFSQYILSWLNCLTFFVSSRSSWWQFYNWTPLSLKGFNYVNFFIFIICLSLSLSRTEFIKSFYDPFLFLVWWLLRRTRWCRFLILWVFRLVFLLLDLLLNVFQWKLVINKYIFILGVCIVFQYLNLLFDQILL